MAEGENAGGNTGAATPWYQGVEGVDDAMVGHFQTKGWDKLTPAAAAVQATKSQREAEKLIGMRADHDFIPVPRDPAKGDMGAVYARLGRPAEAKDYDLKDVTMKDGTALDEALATGLRDGLFKAGVAKNNAPEVVKAVVNYLDTKAATTKAEDGAKLVTERQALATNWGVSPEGLQGSVHMQIAQKAAAALGVAPEAIKALEGQVGYAKVMDMFRNIGTKIGEDKFHTGDGKGIDNGGMMTFEQAQSRKLELKGDKAWVTKYLSGDVTAKREMAALDTIITAATSRA